MDYNYLPLDSTPVNLNQLSMLLDYKQHISITFQAWESVENCRHYLEKKLTDKPGPIHALLNSINDLHDVYQNKNEHEQLDYNLLSSPVEGSGEEVPVELAKLMIALKVKSLSYGLSGVQNPTIQRLMDMHNKDVIPVVYIPKDSDVFSASRYLWQSVVGLGEVWYEGKKRNTKAVEKELGWKQVQLKSPEAIALISGAQYMLSYGIWCLLQATHLLEMAELIAVLSFDAGVGQVDTNIFHLTTRVHDTTRDVLKTAADALLSKVNTTTERLAVFPDKDLIVNNPSQTNESIAQTLEEMKNALNGITQCSLQRMHLLDKNTRPHFIKEKLEIIGGNAASQCYNAVQTMGYILAYELITGIRMLELKRPYKSSDSIETLMGSLKNKLGTKINEDTNIETLNEVVSFLARWKILLPRLYN
jgi:histidine ammonia-lyase